MLTVSRAKRAAVRPKGCLLVQVKSSEARVPPCTWYVQRRLQRDLRDVHILTCGTAGANKGAQVKKPSHAVTCEPGGCTPQSVSPCPRREPSRELPRCQKVHTSGWGQGWAFWLLPPVSAAGDQGEEDPPTQCWLFSVAQLFPVASFY